MGKKLFNFQNFILKREQKVILIIHTDIVPLFISEFQLLNLWNYRQYDTKVNVKNYL